MQPAALGSAGLPRAPLLFSVCRPYVTLGWPGASLMKPLSASEAVWPAMLRTWQLLFRPFAWNTFLKLAGIATITEGAIVSFRYSVPSVPSLDLSRFDRATLFAPEFVTFTLLGISVAVFALFFSIYLVILLRFVFFHCLLYQTREIRTAWDRYQRPAWRMFKGSLLVGLAFLGFLTMVAVGIAITAFTVFTVRTPDGKLDPGVFLILFFPCIGLFLLVCLAALTAEVVLHDFVLPRMAIEDLPFRAAWQAAWQCVRKEKETFCSYLILRVGLPWLVGFLVAVAAWFPVRLVFWILGMAAQGFDAMLEDGSGSLALFQIGFQVLFVFIGLGAGLLIAFALGGPMATWVRSYAMVFYASRYKALGEALYPPPPTA